MIASAKAEIDRILHDMESGADLQVIHDRVRAVRLELGALSAQPDSDPLLASASKGLDGVVDLMATLDGSAIDGLFVGKIRAGAVLSLSMASVSLSMIRMSAHPANEEGPEK
jgi:hypothetical protein